MTKYEREQAIAERLSLIGEIEELINDNYYDTADAALAITSGPVARVRDEAERRTAATLRQKARSYSADARTLERVGGLERCTGGLSGQQWMVVYAEIARVLQGIASDYDGKDRT